MARPFVSVLIDTYNHERFIEQAVVSVLEQDFPAAEREIVVVDDGSTDATPEIVRKFEPRVRLVRKANGGQASAFNAGIPACRGEIVAFLDGDDWWARGKLSCVCAALGRDAGIGFVGHGITLAFEDGSEKPEVPEKDERLRLNSLAAARVFRLRKSFLGTSRMTVRSAVLENIVPVPESLIIEADEYVFTMAAALSDVVLLRQALTHYRIHGGNLYHGAGASTPGLRRKQRVHEALVARLGQELSAHDVPREIVDCVTEILQAEAEQMRLMVDGGAPWETLRAERKLYEVMHADAPRRQRVFRAAAMLPALLLPPRWFYAGRRWLGSREWYRRVRSRSLPPPGVTRVASAKEFRA